jgi:hypothetical protein
MTLPPSPEAQIDVQAIKAALIRRACEGCEGAFDDDCVEIEIEGSCCSEIPDQPTNWCDPCRQSKAAALLDAYEAKVRENAELQEERDRVTAEARTYADAKDSELARAYALASAAEAERDALTAALAEARKERETCIHGYSEGSCESCEPVKP